MRKKMILLVALIATVGVVLASISKKQESNIVIENLDVQSIKKQNDLSAWD